MAGSFESYLDSTYGAAGSPQAEAASRQQEIQSLEAEMRGLVPVFGSADNLGADDAKRYRDIQARLKLLRGGPSLENQIATSHDQSANILQSGSRGAGDLIRQAYEGALAHRVGGVLSANRASKDRLLGEAGTVGLSANLGRRMGQEADTRALQEIGTVSGDLNMQKNLDLASLVKGSATELAGLNQGTLENLINLEAAKRGAAATKSAGTSAALGALGSGLIQLLG